MWPDISVRQHAFGLAPRLRDEANGPAGDQLYFTHFLEGVLRAGPTRCTQLIPFEAPGGIALDPSAGKLYWTAIEDGELWRADADGTNLEVLATGLSDPFQVAIDALAGKVYWTEFFRLARARSGRAASS